MFFVLYICLLGMGGVCSGVNIYKGLLFLFYLKTMIMLEKDIYEFEC